ncbi:MAG TPA: hypothetical protein ACFYD7_03495 [Candidatus Wujingus californicus]|uniref:hypothetical protein n=1 Tax=Candidatus Wujingus californicus TaxID=3367618 RepID=UPI001DD71294|nr:hypothetical protein [Planctomycetota bacterium]MDO8131066.1 hypothetical protein [Candidatus Brocadiales bacterium]
MKPTSAHTIQNYLGLSETFIYSYLKNLKAYNPFNITARLVEFNYMKQSLKAIGRPTEKIKIQHIGVDVEKFQFIEKS